uniref:Uncharacterized protein n=1 Tax=Anopheles dirus TaxID=7168 RepID=A0A182N9B9_9DIPT
MSSVPKAPITSPSSTCSSSVRLAMSQVLHSTCASLPDAFKSDRFASDNSKQVLKTKRATCTPSSMSEKCRLCLNLVNRKRTTIQQNEFRSMMEKVFSFSIIDKEGLPIHVCAGCASGVRNFFSYSLQVQNNQKYLEEEHINASSTLSGKRKRQTTRNSVSATGEDVNSSNSHRADPLSEESTMDLSTHSNDTDFKASVSDSDITPDITPTKKQRTSKTAVSKNSELLYACDECELKLSTKTALYKHRRIHQKEECPVCNLLFRADKIKEHYAKKHPNDTALLTNGEFRCDNCQELFKNEIQLTEHRLPNPVKECPVCLKFSTATHIEKHLAVIASGEIKQELSDDDKPNLPVPVSVPSLDGTIIYYCPTRYKCRKCEEKFYDKVTLAKHQRSHRTAECPVCHKTFRTDKMKQHIASRHASGRSASNELFRCRDCRKLFENESQLTAHQNTHKRQLCPVCKESASTEHIEKHLASLNAINFSDDSDDDLSDQLGDDESLVTDENNCYKCDECDRTFLTTFRLQKHRRVHRKKECPFCPKLFRPDMIVNHIATKHPEQQVTVKKELSISEEPTPV